MSTLGRLVVVCIGDQLSITSVWWSSSVLVTTIRQAPLQFYLRSSGKSRIAGRYRSLRRNVAAPVWMNMLASYSEPWKNCAGSTNSTCWMSLQSLARSFVKIHASDAITVRIMLLLQCLICYYYLRQSALPISPRFELFCFLDNNSNHLQFSKRH